MADFDLAVIGGGINGTGVARDAAGRGLQVVLIEQNDLASATSSASSKLIHGGLRYLEHGEFGLVRTALLEREVLLRSAPHLIRPLRFVLPVNPARRSPLVLRLGLLLYDWLGRRRILPGTRKLDLVMDEAGHPLRSGFRQGYEYSDCFADDARLVVLNAVDAAERGAVIRTYTRCVRADRGEIWHLTVNARGQSAVIAARTVVNAAGAWVETVAEMLTGRPASSRLRLDKGSHIVVRRLYDHDRAYILQAPDRRIVFTIPFQRDFTLIGTTDRSFTGDPFAVAPAAEEIEYLCGVVNEYFRRAIRPADTVWAFAGVRSLYDDGAGKPQDIGREYELVLDARPGAAPLLNVYGGKITTYRRLAEDALKGLKDYLPAAARPWTATGRLPGGDFDFERFDQQVEAVRQRWPFFRPEEAQRLFRAYGTRIESVLAGAVRRDDLGQNFAAGLTEAEVRYMMAREWAQSADDVLWRRSKLGLWFTAKQRSALESFMAHVRGRDAPP